MELLSPRGGTHLKVNYIQSEILKIRILLENGSELSAFLGGNLLLPLIIIIILLPSLNAPWWISPPLPARSTSEWQGKMQKAKQNEICSCSEAGDNEPFFLPPPIPVGPWLWGNTTLGWDSTGRFQQDAHLTTVPMTRKKVGYEESLSDTGFDHDRVFTCRN